jgi:hypothetical protein
VRLLWEKIRGLTSSKVYTVNEQLSLIILGRAVCVIKAVIVNMGELLHG